MKKFRIDNPFFDFMSRVGDILILNVLFVLTSIPVITMGMSLAALYRVALRMARKECNYPAREYLAACREEWKKSTVIWLILMAAGGLLLFDVMVGREMGNALNAAVGALLLLWGMAFTWIFPVQARFENSVINLLKNAMYMAVRHFPSTAVMLVLNLLPLLCFLLGSTVTALAVPVYITCGFALTARINACLLNRVFRYYISGRIVPATAEDEQ